MRQIKNLVNIGTGDIIGNIISAGFWIYLAILINPESYGELHYLISIVGIVSYLTFFGSQHTITVYIAKKIEIQSTFNFISLIAGIFGFLVLFLIFNRLDMGFLVLGYTMSNLVIGELLGKKEFKGYLKYILIQKSLTPILGIGFFLIFGMEGLIYGLALSYIGFSFRIIKNFKNIKIDFSSLSNKKGFIINNYFTTLSGTFHGHIDKIIIMPIIGASVLGNYSLSLQIISMMTIGTSILFKYILPQEASGNDVKKMKKLLVFSSIIMTFIGFFIVPIILPIVFPKYLDAIDAIRIMSLGLIPMSIVKIYTSKFLALEKSRFILIGLVISLSILIPTMILFGTWYGIMGVATSFVLATIIQSVYFFIMSKKWDKKDHNEK